MDKRSFNLLFTVVAASMIAIGTYKMAKRKSHTRINHIPAAESRPNK